MTKTMVTRARVEIGLREAELVATCALLPHGAGIGGLVALEIPRAELPADILDEFGIPASDEGVLAVPCCRWWLWEDGEEDVENFEDGPLRVILADFFAVPVEHVRGTALRLAKEALHRGFAQDLEAEPRHLPGEENVARVTVH